MSSELIRAETPASEDPGVNPGPRHSELSTSLNTHHPPGSREQRKEAGGVHGKTQEPAGAP